MPKSLQTYVRRYNAEFSRPWSKSSYEVLNREIEASQVILGADFHAFSQSQRIHLRLLRNLPLDRPVVLGLEAISSRQQKTLDQYLEGRLEEGEFLKRVKWQESWGFPFENYRPLLQLAKERGFRVRGVNREETSGKIESSLLRRDEHCADLIAQWLRKEPQTLIYVIIGDLHLAERHLPLAIEKRAPVDSKVLTILQNSEHLYFRLAKARQEQKVEVMRASGGRFCVLGSPPWVKWQSYLMYLEQTEDRDLEAGEADYTDHVASYAVFLARDLGLRVGLEDLAVFTPQQSSVWHSLEKKLKSQDLKMAQALFQADRSFYAPQAHVLFLSRASVNHAATLAGQYIHAALGDRMTTTWNFPAQFEAQIWIEAVGFFCSKMMNHKRKADRLNDLKMQLEVLGNKKTGQAVLRLALAQRLGELTGKKRRFHPLQKKTYLEAARIVGHMMGERLFRVVTQKTLSLTVLIEWLQMDPSQVGFEKTYYQIVDAIERGLEHRGGGE